MRVVLGLFLLMGLLFGQSRALIIGCCSEYRYLKDINPLFGTVNDAKYMRDILISRGEVKSRDISYLVGRDATYNNIKKSIDTLKNSNLKKGDRLYLFYSGHGTSLSDEKYFGREIRKHKFVKKWIKESTGFVPYDFNPRNIASSLLITKIDFRPMFEILDSRGVQIVWIADACYAGNAYRSSAPSKTKHYTLDQNAIDEALQTRRPYEQKPPIYKNFIFYGASLHTNPTQERVFRGQLRGEFSIELQKCLEEIETKIITHGLLQSCLLEGYTQYGYNPAFYPNGDALSSSVIMRGAKKRLSKPKQRYRDRLFSLKSKNPLLEISIRSEDSESKVIKTFCNGELISVKIGKNRGKYLIALSMDKNGKVILIYPNPKQKQKGSRVLRTEVQAPFGKDRLKIFTTNNKETYNSISQYSVVLNSGDIEMIYKILKKDKTLQTAHRVIETLSTSVDLCLSGD